MKKLIFRNIFWDITNFFLIASLSLTLIVWVIQAVNYLDFVSEDGHSFKVYFMYSLLSLPKIYNKLILFVFFISIFFTLSKYEENNEILIFWNYGIKKTEFINHIIKLSFLYFAISIVFSVFLVPKTQTLAKSYIRDSNIDYFPSLIKTQHFNDTARKLTIFVEKKNNEGLIENIFIKENLENNKSKIISAKNGMLVKKNNLYYLILNNGNIVNIDSNNTNIIKFKKSELSLSRFGSKSTVFPKIQETTSNKLIKCLQSFLFYNQSFEQDFFRCNESSVNAIFQETYKRLILPFYIILSGFIASCLIIRSKNQINFSKFKVFIFLSGFALIIFSEGSSNLLTIFNLYKSFLVLIPIVTLVILYLIIISSKKNKIL